MKARNLNNSSRKTRANIKKVFAQLLAEKRELSKITVTELVQRANISRGAFYSHYDDIYGVAEDYENELFECFFDNATLLSLGNADEFVDALFRYLRENDENYKLLCRSNDLLFTAKKMCSIVSAKLLEICNNNPNCVNKKYLELDIDIFIEGFIFEYIRYCRGANNVTLDDLYNFTCEWIRQFTARRAVLPTQE